MGMTTKIEWTDATWPIVQGCDYVSPGCRNCYAVNVVNRLSANPNSKVSAPMGGLVAKNSAGRLHWTGKVALRHDRLDWPLKWKQPRRIFVSSHGDLFHEDVSDEFISQVFAIMSLSSQHTFQVLTKRPQRMLDYLREVQEDDKDMQRWVNGALEAGIQPSLALEAGQRDWPLPNVWLGVSAETQKYAEERIPLLLQTPAVIRFVSAEPLLGAMDLHEWLPDLTARGIGKIMGADVTTWPAVDWLIVGGESGPRARPMHPDWARSLRDQAGAAHVAFFFKQWGEWAPVLAPHVKTICIGYDGRILDNTSCITHARQTIKDGRYVGHWHYGQTDGPTRYLMAKVSKKLAGATLDGREWREMPDGRLHA